MTEFNETHKTRGVYKVKASIFKTNIYRFVIIFCCLISLSAQADVNHYFSSIQRDPNALYIFLRAMPKGGELHYHLAGGAYPEVMLDLAATGPYCLDKVNYSVNKGKNCSSAALASNDALYEQYLRAWSLKNFIPTDGKNAEDHFFAAFYKFMPIVADHEAELLADVLKRADSENEQYMEVLIIPDNAQSASFADLGKDKKSDAEK